MFEAVFAEASIFKKIIDAIKDFVKEINFECTPNGIEINTMDSAHVSLINLVLRSDGFEQFKCDKPYTVGINMEALAKIVKCGLNDDKLTLFLKENDPNNLYIVFSSEKKKIKYKIRLLELNSVQLSLPPCKYNCVIKMTSIDFKQQCIHHKIMGDSVTIIAKDNYVCFAVGGEFGNVKAKYPSSGTKDDPSYIFIKATEETNLTFSLEYLNKFAKSTNLSPIVRLYIDNHKALKVVYRIDNIGYIHFYLAPKIVE
jgi:proliferating cell nuclear antigen